MVGVDDPDTIDLVTHDRSTGEFAVIMSESRRWGTVAGQADQLMAKINAYAAYVLDEGLLVAFPEAAGCPVRIQIDCVDEPDQAAAEVIEAARHLLAQHGVGVVVNRLGAAAGS
jgi:hypothetical protein